MSLHDHTTGGDDVFANDAEGTVFRLRSLELLNNDADDKPDLEGRDYSGNWLEVSLQDRDCLMNAPAEMIEELQRLEAEVGDVFEVTRCEKKGSRQTSPFEVNLEALEEGQDRL